MQKYYTICLQQMIIEYWKKYLTPKVISIILFLYFVFLLLLQTSLHWKSYTRPFQKEFLYTLYYNSQWVNPESKYGIGDDGLYQVAGHTLATKHEFFTINPEMPPLAKYIYGYSILFFGNAEAAAAIMFIFAVIAFAFLVNRHITNRIFQRGALIFFITDPLLFEQSYITMFDLPQLLFLLLHMLAMTSMFSKNISRNRQILLALVAGITLGLFISVKIAFLASLIVLIDIFILYKLRRLWQLIPIGVLSGLVYTSSYLMYFVQGHTLIEFLKNQKWMLHFYLSSHVQPVYGTALSTLIVGKTIGWGEHSQWTHVSQWTVAWSAYLIAFFINSMNTFRRTHNKIDPSFLSLVLLSSGLLVAYIFLPFFTRYLVLLLPFLIIIFFKTLESIQSKRSYIIGTAIFLMHYFVN